MKFGDDWPGVFIRGDNALMSYAPALRRLLDGTGNALTRVFDDATLRDLLRDIEACESPSADAQRCRAWAECVAERSSGAVSE